MKKSELTKVKKNVVNQQEAESYSSTLNRVRSITVGTAFGGTTEVGMRANNGVYLWCLLQATEAMELIHQLAANIGCHISIQPRQDFGSWRKWNETTPNMLTGGYPQRQEAPPQAKVEHKNQPKLSKPIRSNKDEPMAIEKPVNRRSTKRAAKTS
jgi:hypothetical protein